MATEASTPNQFRHTERRVLVACDCHTQYQQTLNTAGRVATLFQAELSGLFVENSHLLHMAALPFSTHTITLSGESRPVDSASMQRSMRALARQMRSSIEQLATQQHINYSFDVVRGQLINAMLEAARSRDLLILHSDQQRHIQQLHFKPAQSRGHFKQPIVTLYDSSATADETLSVAAQLARTFNHPLLVLVEAATDIECQSLITRADALLQSHAIAHSFQTIATATADQLDQTTKLNAASGLVINLGNIESVQRLVEELSQKLSCTLFIVR